MHDLQSRWKIEGRSLVYYGLRNEPFLFCNTVKLSASQKAIVEKLPCPLTESEQKILGKLMGVQVVPRSQKKRIPSSFNECVFCKTCAANDFIIPGLEFNEEGLCPICQTKDRTARFKSILPVCNSFERCKRSRFDVALFFTGGKDSTFLLYHLSRVLGLRVLAMTWEIPFLSECAKKSIENAKKAFPNVEFIERKMADADLRKIYRRLYALSQNTCACPSLAYVLFYPELVANRIPYFVAGNEPAQLLGLYYNHMAPAFAYSFSECKPLHAVYNLWRILTLRPPLKKGQFQTLSVIGRLAGKKSTLQTLAGYENELVDNIAAAIREVPSLLPPLKRTLRHSSRTGNIPAFVQVDLNDISGGCYRWEDVKRILREECGWSPDAEIGKGLHTSCTVERCKEHSQFLRFYRMESKMIPFSALEIAIASGSGAISREEAIAELRRYLGFSLEEVAECAVMKEYLAT